MSTFFGIFDRNNTPIKEETLQVMVDSMSYWKPDETHLWTDASIALGHAMLWNAPESKYEHLPLEKNALILTMDARIDNRSELSSKLKLPDKPLSQIGDSEFILAAYEKWGTSCPQHLLGDFAFAIWDPGKQHIFCARDHVGVKQFYYHLSDGLFLFGNDLKSLTKYPDISKKINDEALANYIVHSELRSKKLTFFDTFQKLLPAHTLTITALKSETKCYWRLEDAPKIKLENAEAYAKKLRELLEVSVYARMRSDYPITSHLSGGLDSSTIAVLAARKLKETNEKLLAFNWLHEPGEDDNAEDQEWSNSKTIAQTEGIDHHYVALSAEDIYKHMSKLDISYGETCSFWYEYPVRKATQKKNSRTILSGWGGDEFATYHGASFHVDLLIHGKFILLFKELKEKVKRRKTLKHILGAFYYRLVIPLTPRSLYCKMPKITCDVRDFLCLKENFKPLLNKEYAKPKNFTMQAHTTIIKHMLASWENYHLQCRIESWGNASIINKLEYRYPLLDKRILEFIVGTPGEFFIYNDKSRFIFKMAAEGLLPKKILWKTLKAEPNRVKHIIQLLFIALKKFRLEKESNYIEVKRLIQLLDTLEKSSCKESTYYHLFSHLEASYRLLNSKEINI